MRPCQRLNPADEALAILVDRLVGRARRTCQRLNDGQRVLDPMAQLRRQHLALRLRFLALADVSEKNAHPAFLGIADRKGIGVEIPSERGGRRLEPLRLAGCRDTAIDLEPVVLLPGDHLPRGPSYGIGQAGLAFECGIDFQEPVVDRPRAIEDDLEDGEPLVDGSEQGLVALLAFAKLSFGLPPRGDVDECQDHPVDPVLDRAIGAQTNDEPAAVAALHLGLGRGEIAQDAPRVVLDRIIDQPAGEVGDRPADVHLGDVEELRSSAA